MVIYLEKFDALHTKYHVMVVVTLSGWTKLHFCVCSKPASGLFVLNGMKWEALVWFADIGGIVYLRCLYFLYIRTSIRNGQWEEVLRQINFINPMRRLVLKSSCYSRYTGRLNSIIGAHGHIPTQPLTGIKL